MNRIKAYFDRFPLEDEETGDNRQEFDAPDAVETVANWLRLFVAEDQVVELRAIGVSTPGLPTPHTKAGFFDSDHLLDMAEAALELSGFAKGVYFTLNPLRRELLDESANVYATRCGGKSASDKDVLCRRWLLVDADPTRPAEVSATDAEKAQAAEVIRCVKQFLAAEGWPEPIAADSGNGFHLLYRVELPADDGGLVKRVLAALATRFDSDGVKIDTSVANASRIVKLYGTIARKGEESPERPHRFSRVLDVPAELQVVPGEKLQRLAKEAPETATPRTGLQPPAPYQGDRQEVLRRARAYLLATPPAISGQGGHDRTIRAAGNLVRGFGLSVHEARPLFAAWNATCQPPWNEKELLHKLNDADEYPGERGWLLNDRPAEASEAIDDPHRLARAFIRSHFTADNCTTLRYWRGDWYGWDGRSYRRLDHGELRARLCDAVKRELDQAHAKPAQGDAGRSHVRPSRHVPKVTIPLVNNTLQALGGMTLLDGRLDAPCWLGAPGPHPAHEMLAAANGLVHVPSLVAGQDCLSPLTPTYFGTSALDYAVDPHAPEPAAWLDFLRQLWPDDPESIGTLQEWFGYCLSSDTSQQKMLFVLGPKRSGKGTIARVLTALLGADNVVGPTLCQFASNFGLSSLIGKPLAVIADARLSGRSDQGVITERLLSITGEDRLDIDRKNRELLTVKLPTRLMVLSNELPRLTDASGALASRMVVLRLARSWYDREDTRLTGRLTAELPGIVRWAAAGLKRLQARGHFVQPESGREACQAMHELSSPVQAFVEDCCELGDAHQVGRQDLYRAWGRWCEEHGHQPSSEADFGRRLKAACPFVRTSRPGAGPCRRRVHEGIGLKLDAQVDGVTGSFPGGLEGAMLRAASRRPSRQRPGDVQVQE